MIRKYIADNTHSLFETQLWQRHGMFTMLSFECCISLLLYHLYIQFIYEFNVMVVVLLLVIPFWISCIRIIDYNHNYSDVICGAFVESWYLQLYI